MQKPWIWIPIVLIVVGGGIYIVRHGQEQGGNASSGEVPSPRQKARVPGSASAHESSPASGNEDELKFQRRLAQLQAQLNEGGAAYTLAAEELIKIGTRESIRMLVWDIANRAQTSETYVALHKLAELDNREVADWLLELLPELPNSAEQGFLQYRMIADIIGTKATPEALSSVGALIQNSPDGQTRDLLLDAMRSAGSPDSVPVLMQFAGQSDWQVRDRGSVSASAAAALGRQGTPENVQYLFALRAGEPDAEAPGTVGLDRVKSPKAVPVLKRIAQGAESAYQDPNSRVIAIRVLGNIDHEDGWSALQTLQDDPNAEISQAAKQTLNQVGNRLGLQFE